MGAPKLPVTTFDPQRLRIARLAAGMTAKELADSVGVNPSAISQYEHGYTAPSRPTRAELALTLGVPSAWFSTSRTLGAVTEASAHFRSLRSSSKRERGQAFARAVMAWDICRVVETMVALPPVDIPSITPPIEARVADLDAIAWEVRRAWAVPRAPLANMVRLLEAHGVVVIRSEYTTRRVHAFSYDFGTRPLVSLSDDSGDAARSRFDAAHELGHLVMHGDAEPGDGVLEQQAHGFAAGFLMPAQLVHDELPRTFDLSQLAELKARWGVSIAALLYRSRELGRMPEPTYRRAVTKMAVLGYRTNEHGLGDLGVPEQPVMLRRALEALAGAGMSSADVADLAGLSEELVESFAGGDERLTIAL